MAGIVDYAKMLFVIQVRQIAMQHLNEHMPSGLNEYEKDAYRLKHGEEVIASVLRDLQFVANAIDANQPSP